MICLILSVCVVCKSCHSSAPISDPPPQQVPWILEERPYPYVSDHIRFFSCISGKFYKVHVPHYLSVKGPAFDGDLHIYDYLHKGSLLVNPLTNHVLHLPSLDDGEPFHGGIFHRGGNYVLFHKFNSHLFPIQAFYHLGGDRWIEMRGAKHSQCQICHNGMYFFVDSIGDTRIISIATGTLTCVVPPPDNRNTIGGIYLVESSGKILKVLQMYSLEREKVHFNIYKLYFRNGNKNAYWVKIDSIDDSILFLSVPKKENKLYSQPRF